MKEPIEDFLRIHKEAFDVLEPGRNSWQVIRKQIKRPETKSTIFWKIAASVLLLTTSGLIFYQNLDTAMENPVADREFVDQEIQFIRAINHHMDVLEQLGIEQKNQDLLIEEASLEKEYQSLKSLYLQNPGDDRIKESLIQNLRMRGQILMEQIELLKSLNPQKDDPAVASS